MSQDVPDEMKIKLEQEIIYTTDYVLRLDKLGPPDFVALGTGENTAAGRNRAPQARVTMDHVASILQVAHYHIHLAKYERIRHRDYIVPSNPDGGNFAAYCLFTSFVSHAVAVERHLTLALSLRFGFMNHNNTRANGDIGEVRKLLAQAGHPDLAEVLRPFQENAKWQWLKKYRDRWEHRDPMRVKELGVQFSNRRDYWKEEQTTLPGGKPGRALTLTITAGDPAETSVDEMLENGIYCFNLMAKQVDRYISILEAAHQSPMVIKV